MEGVQQGRFLHTGKGLGPSISNLITGQIQAEGVL